MPHGMPDTFAFEEFQVSWNTKIRHYPHDPSMGGSVFIERETKNGPEVIVLLPYEVDSLRDALDSMERGKYEGDPLADYGVEN